MKVAVTILNWNGFEDTLECIESLEKSTFDDFKIFVIDNGSTDDSLEKLRALGDRIYLIENEKNDGFAGGANKIVKLAVRAGAEFIFLLNNDTTVDPECLSKLLDAHTRLGEVDLVLAPRMYYYDSPEEIWHDGHLWELLKGEMVPIQNYPIWKKDGFNKVDHIIGAGLFFSAEIYKEYGLFDARFFLNYEETDWEFRIRRQGVKLYTISYAKIWHKISKSFTHSVHSTFYCERNRLLFIDKNFRGVKKAKLILYSEFPRQFSIVLKMIRRFFGRLFYKLIGNKERYNHTRTKYLDNKMAMLAWRYYLKKKFGPFDGDFNKFK
ncbi:MAG: glycosyltransferase family 2 protein [Deltaproteobacteria bacterium]|nr:MAG: glycosyltransferase family 2 protein [Deltaproteobacteria bacterium]